MQLNEQEPKPHVITVRLNHKLGEQLREVSYKLREKKQPILRDAVCKLILTYEKANHHKQGEILDYIASASLSKLIPPCTAEKLKLDAQMSGLLRWFAFESKQTYQSIVLVALDEYLKFLYPVKGNHSIFISHSHGEPNDWL